MDTKTPKFEAQAQADGRIAYTVADVVTTYDLQEAIDLMQTGVFRINCPLTRQALTAPKASVRWARDAKGVYVENYEVT